MMARLPRSTRLLYASAAVGGNAIGRSKDLWLLYFFAPPADADISPRAPTLAVGGVLFAIRFIEAFDDPLIGWWSDRTRSRWGRRIPFVLAATPFFGLFFVLLWMPPTAGESAANVVHLFIVLWFFHLCSTLSGGPFEALMPEIAPDPDDRVSVVTWQVAFGVAGAALALVASGFIIDTLGYQAMALVMATVMVASRYLALAGVWRRATATARAVLPPARPLPFRQAMTLCLRNEQFMAFVPSYILYNMGVLMLTGAIPYLVEGVLEHEDEGVMVAIINAIAIGVLVLALPLIAMAARRRGKRWVYAAGMVYASFYFPLMFFVGFIPGIPKDAQALVFAVFVGFPLAPVQTFQNALIADITDYDALRTGQRREATYYATQAMFEKTASALAPLLLAALLVLGSTSDNPTGIRLVGPLAGLSTFAGYLVFRRYRLPDTVTAETVRGLLDRQPGS